MTPFPKSFRFTTLVAALALCALASSTVDAASGLATATATEGRRDKLDVAFHATLK